MEMAQCRLKTLLCVFEHWRRQQTETLRREINYVPCLIIVRAKQTSFELS
jgi:hypothetical protein